MQRLKAERRRFEYRECTLLGFVTNAVALLRPAMQRTGKGVLPMLFGQGRDAEPSPAAGPGAPGPRPPR